jgi:hypothetical protein
VKGWVVAGVLALASCFGGCLPSDDDGGAGGAGGSGGGSGTGASAGTAGGSGSALCAAQSAGCDQPDLFQCTEDHALPITPETCNLLGGQFRPEGCSRVGVEGYCADVLTTGEPDATQYYYSGRSDIQTLKDNCRFGPTWCEP